jgi:hypothetical protein
MKLLIIRRIFGTALIVVGLYLFAHFFFGPLSGADRDILDREAATGIDYGTPKKIYLIGAMACCFIGGALVKK